MDVLNYTHLKPSKWYTFIHKESKKEYWKRLVDRIRSEKLAVYPPVQDRFAICSLCPRRKVRVVILGQDPYHGPNMAMGMSFSVHPDIPVPKSLNNIYTELCNEYVGREPRPNGDLTGWAKQGVFLLNTALTVVHGQAGSHLEYWQPFANSLIQYISDKCDSVVFLLWGKPAQSKKKYIDGKKHHIIETSHPSPLSAHRGFFGSNCFSRANDYLLKMGKRPIEWLE